MKRIYTYLIILLSISAFSARAMQDKHPAVGGKVIDVQQLPLEKVTVYLLSAKVDAILKTAVTDEKGQFSIANVSPGNYYVQVSSVGFVTLKTEILTVSDTDVQVKDIVLVAESQAIGEVHVEGKLPLVQQRDGKLILNVENSTLAAGNNALDIVQRAPGVSLDKDENLQLMGQQGVNVTIDGRQTYMSGEQLTSLLKTMNGDQIKSIEVSTVRSAKDDAEGAVGTINIVLKRNTMKGFNGAFTLSGAQGIHSRGNGSLNLNYKKNNTTVFGSYGYTNDKRQFDLSLERNIVSDTDPRLFNQAGAMVQLRRNHDYRFGIEQKTSQKNTLVLQFTGNNDLREEENNSLTRIGPNAQRVDSLLITSALADNSLNRYSINLNDEYLLDTLGGKLVFDGDWSRFRNNSINDYGYLTTNPVGDPLYPKEIEQSRAPVDIDILVGKIDFVKNIGKGKVEAGVKYSHVKSDNDLQFDRLLGDKWEEYPGRPNHFLYTEEVAAAYTDYSRGFGKFNVKLGVRAEYTQSDGNSITLNKRVRRDYLDFFPSASVGYNLSENHVLSASYARKVQRPNYRSLNPFTYYIDKFTYSLGNPYLNPQYTDGVTLNYTLYKRFNVTLGMDITHDAIVESIGQDDQTGESWITSENLAENVTSYLNVNAPIQIGRFWTMNNNVAGIYMHFKGPIAGEYANVGSFFIQGQSTNNFRIYKGWSAELSANYTSEFVYNVYRIHARWGADIGVSYNFNDKRSSLKLAMTDVFHTQKNRVSSDFGKYDLRFKQYNDNQTVRLTFTYKFGNLKQQSKRLNTDSEEKSRAQ